MDTITFNVPIGTPDEGKPQQYIANSSEYRLTEMEDEALVFSVCISTTPMQDLGIQQLEHEIAGGLAKYLDLQTGVERSRQTLYNDIEKIVWPGGRPEAESAEEQDAQAQALDNQYRTHQSTLKSALMEMKDMIDRVAFLAAWPTIIVNPPNGWEELHSKLMPTTVLSWIRLAYSKGVADSILEKTQLSAS